MNCKHNNPFGDCQACRDEVWNVMSDITPETPTPGQDGGVKRLNPVLFNDLEHGPMALMKEDAAGRYVEYAVSEARDVVQEIEEIRWKPEQLVREVKNLVKERDSLASQLAQAQGEAVSLRTAADRPAESVSLIHQYDAKACCDRFDAIYGEIGELKSEIERVRNAALSVNEDRDTLRAELTAARAECERLRAKSEECQRQIEAQGGKSWIEVQLTCSRVIAERDRLRAENAELVRMMRKTWKERPAPALAKHQPEQS